jgi:hypothetical protein
MIKRNGSEFGLWKANLDANSSRRLMALGLALLVAWLLVMVLAVDTSASDDVGDLAANLVRAVDESAGNDSSDLAANPELSAVRRYARSTSDNLEIALRESYAIFAGGTSRSAAMAANPELFVVDRFTGPASNPVLASGGAAGQQNDSNFFAANPEVMTARRHGLLVSDCGPALGC